MTQPLHVVFGAGQVGTPLAERLRRAGYRVRVVRHSEGSVAPGLEVLRGDAADTRFCVDAVAGAAAVYHCMNPPYDRVAWARLVPLYLENLIAAAARASARLVVLDNLYMLGRTGGQPMNEDTPMNPCSKKGEIRARAAERLFDAHRRGDVLAVAGRASDFYGPGGARTHFGDLFWKPALAGQTARILVDSDARHTYHFIPDVAAGLEALGTGGDDVLGRAWMLPCQPAGTMRELVQCFSDALGRPIKLAAMPRWLLGIIGAFVPIVREVGEMLYQWDEPFVVDDRRFRERFGVEGTDGVVGAQETVKWAVATYSRPSSR